MDIAARSENDKARKKSVSTGAGRGYCCPIFQVDKRIRSRDISERDNQEYMYWW